MEGIDLGIIGGAIVTGCGIIAGAIKLVVGAFIDQLTQTKLAVIEAKGVMLENTKAMTINNERTTQQIASNERLAAKIDIAFERINQIGEFVQENTNPHAVPLTVSQVDTQRVKRTRTPPGGYRVINRKGDDDA